MSSEKRSVQTDALQTLGMVNIGSGAGRDAIHLAVEPVTAGEVLRPGADIGMRNGRAYNAVTSSVRALGIVDPFLNGEVLPGERFWLIVYPRQITSLRHVWSHPDFPEDGFEAETVALVSKTLKGQSESEKFVQDLAHSVGRSPQAIIDAAEEYLKHGDYLTGGGEMEGESVPPEFWDHYEKIKGEKVDADKRGNFFNCSC